MASRYTFPAEVEAQGFGQRGQLRIPFKDQT